MLSNLQEFMQENCQMHLRLLATCLEIGEFMVQEALLQDPKMRNVFGVSVSHALSEENKFSHLNLVSCIRGTFRDRMDRCCNKL